MTIIICFYFSVWTVFRRQNLTYTDVRFWRIQTSESDVYRRQILTIPDLNPVIQEWTCPVYDPSNERVNYRLFTVVGARWQVRRSRTFIPSSTSSFSHSLPLLPYTCRDRVRDLLTWPAKREICYSGVRQQRYLASGAVTNQTGWGSAWAIMREDRRWGRATPSKVKSNRSRDLSENAARENVSRWMCVR